MLRRIALIAFCFCTSLSFAQAPYPTKPVRVINPFPPGGSIDVVARPVFDRLRVRMGQPFVMDFRPGAGTIIGASIVAKAPPDGYTLYAAAGQHAIIPSVYSNLPFDVIKDFAPITVLATGPYLLVVHPSVPAKSLKQLIALAKSMPGKMNYSSASPGSGFHMAAELLKLMAGIDMAHIPYKGGAPAATAVLSGEVDLTFASPAVILPHVTSGRLRGIVVTTRERFKQRPELPTMAEAGLPDFEAASWYGMFAPGGTPKEIIDRLATEIAEVLKMPEMREVYEKLGLEPAGGTPEEFREIFLRDLRKWEKVAKSAGVRIK